MSDAERRNAEAEARMACLLVGYYRPRPEGQMLGISTDVWTGIGAVLLVILFPPVLFVGLRR